MWLIDLHCRPTCIVSIKEKEILYCSWDGAEVIEKRSSVWKTLSTKRVSKLLNVLFIKITANLKKIKTFNYIFGSKRVT